MRLRSEKNFPKQKGTQTSLPLISWQFPGTYYVQLNTDGASRGNPGIAGCGGQIRDAAGRWLSGFMAFVHKHSGRATGYPVWFGTSLEQGIKEGITDAMMVISLIDSAEVEIHPCGGLIADVRLLLRRDWECHFSHTLREGTDILAKEACSIADDFIEFEQPPESVLGS